MALPQSTRLFASACGTEAESHYEVRGSKTVHGHLLPVLMCGSIDSVLGKYRANFPYGCQKGLNDF